MLSRFDQDPFRRDSEIITNEAQGQTRIERSVIAHQQRHTAGDAIAIKLHVEVTQAPRGGRQGREGNLWVCTDVEV